MENLVKAPNCELPRTQKLLVTSSPFPGITPSFSLLCACNRCNPYVSPRNKRIHFVSLKLCSNFEFKTWKYKAASFRWNYKGEKSSKFA